MPVKRNKPQKNKQQATDYQVDITEVGAQGDGIGMVDGLPIYVPMTMAGDKVTARVQKENKNGLMAELVSIDTPSPDRQAPVCQHFGRCGGCQLQMLPDQQYSDWVKSRVAAALAHHGFEDDIITDPIISPLASRRRVALKVLKTGANVVLGFNVKSSAQIVDLKECPVTLKAITDLFDPLRKLLGARLQNRASGTITITQTATGLDLLVDIPHTLTLEDREALTDFATSHDLAAIHWMDQGFLDPVLVRREPVMHFGDQAVALPPAAFVQATQEGEDALVGAVKAALKGHKRMADLFAGIGTFSLPMASDMQVLAVEGAKAAIDALQNGVNQASGLKKVVALHRDLFRRPLSTKELSAFDAVVFDPPRAGAKEQVLELAQSEVRTIVGVSCNPNTFSRDARILVDGGYHLETVIPVDQFLYSPHVEIVGVFKKDAVTA